LFSKAAVTAAKVTAGIVATYYATKKSVGAVAAFGEQMAMVSTMLDEQSMHLMPRYNKALRHMSLKFGESTATLSKGLYDILSASVAPTKAIEVLSAAVKAAKAGFTNTAIAADAITTVLNSYQLSAERAAYVSDILFAIVKRGKTTFAELAPAIGKVAAIANVAGLSLEELGAAIATMTRAGLQTDVAMTSLRGLMNAFLKPSKEAKEVARKFGFELNTATLQAKGLTGVLEKLKGATAEELAVLIPNVRGLAGFAAALGQAEKQTDDLRLMQESAGLTQEAYNKSTSTLMHTLRQAGQAGIILAKALGTVLLPVIWPLTKAVLGLAWAWNKVIDLWQWLGTYTPKVSDNIKDMGDAAHDLEAGLGGILKVGVSAEGFKEIAADIENATNKAETFNAVIQKLGDEIWELSASERSAFLTKAEQQGSTGAQMEQIKQLYDQKKLLEGIRDIEAQTKRMQEEAATLGMTDVERQRYEYQQMLKDFQEIKGQMEGTPAAELYFKKLEEAAKAFGKELKKLEKGRFVNELQNKIESLKESIKKPIDKFKEFAAELKKAFSAQEIALSIEEARALMRKKAEELGLLQGDLAYAGGSIMAIRRPHVSYSALARGGDQQINIMRRMEDLDKERNRKLDILVNKHTEWQV
jgi:TP901 family phage tail tape measure protein